MSEIICVTNRRLCREDFLTRIERLAESGVSGIILREKDLSESEYRALAEKAAEICDKYDAKLILHSFYKTAIALSAKRIHLPLHVLKEMTEEEKSRFIEIGASCHSVSDAVFAEKSGCTYITAGHVFETDCKKGVTPRGLEFLRNVCESVSIPVYAIGGISPENAESALNSGAKGVCVMSGLMRCGDVKKYLESYERKSESL